MKRCPTRRSTRPARLMPLLGMVSLLLAVAGTGALYAQYGRSMTTVQYDNAHTGWNPDEVVLNVDNVNADTFGKRWTTTLGGVIFGAPLYVSGVVINNQARNVVYAATENNFIYALDAATGDELWPAPYFLGTPGLATNLTCPNIATANIGITSTMVIDLETGTLFAAGLTCEDTPCAADSTMLYKLAAVDLATGQARPGWPVTIDPPTTPRLDPRVTLCRGALLLANGLVYVPFGGNSCDRGSYHGWVVGVNKDDPAAPAIYFRTQGNDLHRGIGIWAYGGMAADEDGNLYLPTGNSFAAPGLDYSNAILRLNPDLTFSEDPKDFFMPSNWVYLNTTDRDLGSSTPTLIPPQEGSNTPNLIFVAGKFGVGHLINRDNLGGIAGGDGTIGEGVYSAMVYFSTFNSISSNAAYYYDETAGPILFIPGRGTQPECGTGSGLAALALDVDTDGNSSYHALWCVAASGAMTPVVTSAPGQTGILWLVDRVLGVLYAFNAATGELLYSSAMVPGDALGTTQNFLHIAAIDGQVFVANRTNSIVAYGLR